MEKVIPQGLNYADMKPEAIQNMIKLVRYTPVSNVQSADPNDVIRFQMQGNGFYDPYSAYIKVTVEPHEIPVPTGVAGDAINGLTLDRSAHSLINRLVIKSSGTEIERIENYDVVAAMINDMIYSHEQNQFHHYEGFPSKYRRESVPNGSVQRTAAQEAGLVLGAAGHQIQMEPQYAHNGNFLNGFDRQNHMLNKVGEHTFYKLFLDNANLADGLYQTWTGGLQRDGVGVADALVNPAADFTASQVEPVTFCIPIYSGILGVLMPDKKLLPLSLMPLEVEFTINPHAFYQWGAWENIVAAGANAGSKRRFKITSFEIFAHTLFFEQEVHRSLEAVVAEHGIFIHFNTFYQGAVAVNAGAGGTNIVSDVPVNVHFKSINSVHWVYLYAGYLTDPRQRKLHFVSHRLTSMQIRNGTDYLPSEPVNGDMGKPQVGHHIPFLIETYKGWNKLHDPKGDAAIDAFSYTNDMPYIASTAGTANAPAEYVVARTSTQILGHAFGPPIQQSQVGRCQYSISFEGEELGKEKNIITGRKGMIPFTLQTIGVKSAAQHSYTIPFVRVDLILYVRPDLVIAVMGK